MYKDLEIYFLTLRYPTCSIFFEELAKCTVDSVMEKDPDDGETQARRTVLQFPITASDRRWVSLLLL